MARNSKNKKVSKRVKMHVKKGDMVLVIAGKEKGNRGKILRVDPKKQMVYVEKLNIQKRHMKPRGENTTGGIIESEGPIHVSNVKKIEE